MNTAPIAAQRLAQARRFGVAGRCLRLGISRNSRTAIGRPMTPMTSQNRSHGSPPRDQRARPTNWPADPPAMPNIWVTPISVAARDAGMIGRDEIDRADQREDAAGALQEAADARRASDRRSRTAARRSRRVAAPSGTTLRGPSWSIATPATRLNGA